MKLIYLLPLLVLISIPSAFAYRGDTYEDVTNPDDSHTWTGGLARWIPTSDTDSQGRTIYKHHFVSDQPTYVSVQNGEASFVFDKNTCSAKIYKGGLIDDSNNFIVGSDSYVPKSSVDGSGTWSVVTSVNNASCVTEIIDTESSITVSGTKTSSAGIFKVSYIKEDGKPLKTILEATNLTSLTDRRFGVVQTQDIPRIIQWGGNQKDLADFVGTTFNRTFLENNSAKFFQFSDTLFFDVTDAWENLESVKVNSVNGNTANISFNFIRNTPILLPNEKIVIDPTFGYTSYNNIYRSQSNLGAGDCASSTWLQDNGAGNEYVQTGITGASSCYVLLYSWNMTSLPVSIDVTDTTVRFDITAPVAITQPTCDFNQLEDNPTTVSGQNRYTDAKNGTNYVSGNTQCQTIGAGYVLDLGTSADADIESNVSAGWFGIGITPNPYTRGATNDYTHFNSMELQVTYSEYCNPVTNLITNTQSTSQIDLSWTKPSPSCNNTNHKIFKSTSGGAYTLYTTLGNVTTASVTGLSSATQNSFKVSTNNTGGYSTNSTIGTNSTLPAAPIITLANPISKTKVNVEFSDNSVGTVINWFKSRYATEHGTWIIFDANSTISTPRFENFTGLTGDTTYNFGIAEGNQGGFGAWSANGTAQTFVTTAGTITITTSNLGDTLNGTAVISITNASPSPVTVTVLEIIQNGTVVKTIPESTAIASGASDTFADNYYLITDGLPHSYQIRATVSNGTGTVQFTSSMNNLTRGYIPTYFSAVDVTQGNVNYTLSRSTNQAVIFLDVNRQQLGNQFNTECLYRTMTQASLNSGGEWHNYTNIGYLEDRFTDAAGTHYYIDCYNDGLLFSVVSYTNSSMLLAGIEVFDDTYGAFIGVPVGVFFIVLVAGMANQRTAPMWIVVILAIAGIMSALGFFTLETNVWALALIAALLGIIVGRKLF